MKTITPNLFVKDINETIAFYKFIGFELIDSVPEEAPFVWVHMVNDHAAIMFQTFESLGEELPEISRKDGGSLILYIKVDHIEALFKKVKDQVKILKGLEKTFYGATEFSILDNNHFVLTFAEHEQQP